MPTAALDIIDRYFTCELTTLGRGGAPQTWPVSPRLLADGRFLVATSIGLPQKAFNIRRDPRVSMLFSEPTGSGVAAPGAVLIQGDAVAEDAIVTDALADPDFAALMQTVARRQPAGAIWHSRVGRRVFWSYYMRILMHVTPRRALYWPNRDFAAAPIELDLSEVRRVE
ncbi:pyridoxamine 5'-phosphate oxidase family protein [Mycobacterium sp. NPDC050041]|uniref:pyridoxamine 5'-phosphate oxidase family protein n=1 Tax=Mycobacterium sp. NPDC050041 TaxID=3364293 RepID=UPI003C2B6A49